MRIASSWGHDSEENPLRLYNQTSESFLLIVEYYLFAATLDLHFCYDIELFPPATMLLHQHTSTKETACASYNFP